MGMKSQSWKGIPVVPRAVYTLTLVAKQSLSLCPFQVTCPRIQRAFIQPSKPEVIKSNKQTSGKPGDCVRCVFGGYCYQTSLSVTLWMALRGMNKDRNVSDVMHVWHLSWDLDLELEGSPCEKNAVPVLLTGVPVSRK
jgi:hypothetical protein